MTRKDEFLEKFKALLREYDATISAREVPICWTQEVSMIVSAKAVFENGELVADSFEINLGTWENGKYYE